LTDTKYIQRLDYGLSLRLRDIRYSVLNTGLCGLI
jgi:hypothetical protein